MIPFTLATEIRTTILDYLTTTFNFQDPEVERALVAFLEQDHGGLFKGPYIHLRLPFRKIEADTPVPLTIRPTFTPYAHQHRAFTRLTTQAGHMPQPTLVTTGTGSGKTECFLFPILDDCYAQQGQPGIKAIILYPMNALATDQATRLARMIYRDERLRGQIRAGLYVGGEGQKHKSMGEDHLIEDRETLRRDPPDILLTNYKMLDFLLLRPEDKPIWAQNAPETLRFLILDELHTYDGAQGSDVACLIRRLKARLHTPEGFLCPVGTSATVGTSEAVASDSTNTVGDTITELTRFAGEIFGTPFLPEAVVTEDRLPLPAFLPDPPTQFALPADPHLLDEQPGESYEAYLSRNLLAWFGDPTLSPAALAGALKSHHFLRALLNIVKDQVLSFKTIQQQLARWDPDFAALATPDQTRALGSFLALIAFARTQEGEQVRPFLTLQVQLWVREMRRLMREVTPKPAFFWRDDVPLHAEPRGLPLYYCRECGHSGWLTLLHDGDDQLEDDHRKIYNAYFDRNKNVRYVYPGRRTNEMEATGERLCPKCLRVNYAPVCEAQACGAKTFPIVIHHELTTPRGVTSPKDLQRCPICGTDEALTIAGSQSASLSSVAISHLYTSPLNRDKKLLAFTDSVQDASHRAAFFGARTYRFNIRTATQAALPSENDLSLSALTEQFFSYWQSIWQHRDDPGQHFTATLMPPDLHDRVNYQTYMQSAPTPIPSSLESELKSRLSWEFAMEYGFNARLGRSLEKVGSSTATPDPYRLEQAAEKLALILPEEIGLLKSVTPTAIRHFITGLLERTRIRGGIYHPLLKRYIEEQGLWYVLTKKVQPLLSPFHKRSRFPKFLADRSSRDVFDTFISTGGQLTWYVDWVHRTLASALGGHDTNEIYRLALDVLESAGLLHRTAAGQNKIYGILTDALFITRQTAGIQCNVCDHKHTIPIGQMAHWVGQACLNYRCAGTYRSHDDFGQRYYRAIYERGQVERIFPHEHTGLLTRKDRETVELGFKTGNRADAPNLLTATPTLEMGIDIGDLSATMACAVPPVTANYLQRIGRAGRETGNSLILTLANAQPHDLYFFEEPLEMIAGTIIPPGCFLDAPNMLKRQLLAFCMDNWTAREETRQLPRNVRDMLSGLKRNGFPLDFLEIYEKHKSAWLADFLFIFGPVVSPENQTLLTNYALGSELAEDIRAAIAAVEAERDELQELTREYRKQIKQIEADSAQYKNAEEEVRKLNQDQAILIEMIKTIEDQYILNFFTDAGLLPNYAFSENGVRLRAVITGLDTQKPGGKGYVVKEYVRGAPYAIRELAPFNTFYAEGRKLPITHLETPGRANALERWQFCDQCSYMEQVQTHHFSMACPSCGSPFWSDHGQKHDMMRFEQAASWSDHYDSLIGDDSEERERETYETGKYFDIRPEFSGGGHIIPSLPFGYEYLNQVTLREINFAKSPAMGQTIPIAAEEQPEQGYKMCKGCGLVLPPQEKSEDVSKKHKRSCRFYNKNAEWEDLYLYRELTSEALRMLLPVSTVLISEKLVTLEACLNLGLKKKFKGDPDHLQILPHMEPAQDGSRRRYLVIYDTIPGGTSFLRDLAKPENFLEVLQLALTTMTSCTCRSDPHKKACYRCLYSYQAQHDLALISRELGIQMLGEIIAHWPKLESIPALSDAHMDSLLESELEQRFLDLLQKKATETPGWGWRETLYHGKRSWELKTSDMTWLIEPQVQLDNLHKVAIPTRADFVIWPQGANLTALPVAVYTDGFAYHVRPNDTTGRVGDDFQKRNAIRASSKFHVWSITWDDVHESEEKMALPLLPFLDPKQTLLLTTALRQTNNPLSAQIVSQNAVQQVTNYLSHPNPNDWKRLAGMTSLALMSPPRPPINFGVLAETRQGILTSTPPPDLKLGDDTPKGDFIYGMLWKYGSPLQLLTCLNQTMRSPEEISQEVIVALRLDDTQEKRLLESFKSYWRQSLLLVNLLQFLPGFDFVSTEQLAVFPPEVEVIVQAEAPGLDETRWAEVLEYAAPECDEVLTACRGAGVSVPIVGYELLGSDGRVLASAELGWETVKIALFLPDQAAEEPAFLQQDWQIFHPDQIEAFLNKLAT